MPNSVTGQLQHCSVCNGLYLPVDPSGYCNSCSTYEIEDDPALEEVLRHVNDEE